MTKFVVEIAEIIKKQYIVDCYTKEEAVTKINEQAPHSVETVTESVWGITTMNEYEYTQKRDYEGYQYDAFKDQDLFRDD
jgi:hypothetical protein